MKLKKLFLLVLTIFLVGQLFLPAFAHGGRTDAYGGHYGDGGYHYHHGYPAHQHPNGTCPYNFDDQTDHSNNGGTSSWPRIEKDKDDSSSSSVEKEENDTPILKNIIGIIFFGSIPLYVLICIIVGAIKALYEKLKNIPKEDIITYIIILGIMVFLICAFALK